MTIDPESADIERLKELAKEIKSIAKAEKDAAMLLQNWHLLTPQQREDYKGIANRQGLPLPKAGAVVDPDEDGTDYDEE